MAVCWSMNDHEPLLYQLMSCICDTPPCYWSNDQSTISNVPRLCTRIARGSRKFSFKVLPNTCSAPKGSSYMVGQMVATHLGPFESRSPHLGTRLPSPLPIVTSSQPNLRKSNCKSSSSTDPIPSPVPQLTLAWMWTLGLGHQLNVVIND